MGESIETPGMTFCEDWILPKKTKRHCLPFCIKPFRKPIRQKTAVI